MADTPIVRFYVKGWPAPGGSKTAFALRRRGGALVLRPGGAPVINMVDAGGKANKEWKAAVAWYGRKFYKGVLLDEALDVLMEFFLERPKDHYRTGSFANELRPSAPKYPTVKPDVLKLCRSTEDALSGVVWVDDNKTIDIHGRKRYCNPTQCPGCLVSVFRVDEWAGPEPTLFPPLKDIKFPKPTPVHPSELLPPGGRPGVRFQDGEPCAHFGCLSNQPLPCVGCGRIGGKGEVGYPVGVAK